MPILKCNAVICRAVKRLLYCWIYVWCWIKAYGWQSWMLVLCAGHVLKPRCVVWKDFFRHLGLLCAHCLHQGPCCWNMGRPCVDVLYDTEVYSWHAHMLQSLDVMCKCQHSSLWNSSGNDPQGKSRWFSRNSFVLYYHVSVPEIPGFAIRCVWIRLHRLRYSQHACCTLSCSTASNSWQYCSARGFHKSELTTPWFMHSWTSSSCQQELPRPLYFETLCCGSRAAMENWSTKVKMIDGLLCVIRGIVMAYFSWKACRWCILKLLPHTKLTLSTEFQKSRLF